MALACHSAVHSCFTQCSCCAVPATPPPPPTCQQTPPMQGCSAQTALVRQDLSCAYLAHHDLASVLSMMNSIEVTQHSRDSKRVAAWACDLRTESLMTVVIQASKPGRKPMSPPYSVRSKLKLGISTKATCKDKARSGQCCQCLPCTDLAHHELESVIIIIIIVVVVVVSYYY